MLIFFFFKQKTAYEMRISDWSSDVCSSDLKAKKVISFSHDDPVPVQQQNAPSPAGSLLVASKGAARSAPPTDPAAINHLVSRHAEAASPEPYGDRKSVV